MPLSSWAPGATPFFAPALAAPEPPTVEMVWVPWPWRSSTVSESVKFSAAATRPLRSGCSRSVPVSRTATLVPVPSNPAAHAAVAPTCLVERSRFAWTLPSSHSFFSGAEAAEREWGFTLAPVTSAQKSAAFSLSAASATPPMEPRTSERSAPRGTGGALRARLAEPSYTAMSGSFLACASS